MSNAPEDHVRAVIFDTETTGLDPATDRIIEIAAIELDNDFPTGRSYHRLIDPDRDIPEEATRIHGYRREHLLSKPSFAEVATEVLSFLGHAGPLIAHNADFDFAILNAELLAAGFPPLRRSRMIDTLALARTQFPGSLASLDALCRRFSIDLSARTAHNALLDCQLLAEVYIELTGGRQLGLELPGGAKRQVPTIAATTSQIRQPRLMVPTAAELAAHAAFVATLQNPVWAS